MKTTAANIDNCCSRLKVIDNHFNFNTNTDIGIEQHVSGVILYEETLYQKTDEGTAFTDLLKSKGIAIGIKVHHQANYFCAS
jgi:fructose-bisphosphate aldolase class 1